MQLPFALVEEMPDVQANFEALSNPHFTWIAPTLLNSWANLASAIPAGYFRDNQGFVHLRGRITSGASGSQAFALPAGYQPGTASFGDLYGCGAINGATPVAATVNISTAGVFIFFAAAITSVGLGGITFLAEN